MYFAAFIVLALSVLVGGGFGLWAGSWLYWLCPLKGNTAYMLGCYLAVPVVFIAIILSFVMPVVHFLAGVGKNGKQ